MKHLTIIVPDGENNLSSIVGAYKIFTRANVYWKETGRKELFTIQLAGISQVARIWLKLLLYAVRSKISLF